MGGHYWRHVPSIDLNSNVFDFVKFFWTDLWDTKTLRIGAIDRHIGQALANIMYSIIECFINTFVEEQVGIPPTTTAPVTPAS